MFKNNLFNLNNLFRKLIASCCPHFTPLSTREGQGGGALLFLLFFLLCSPLPAQIVIDLTGVWELSLGDSLHFNDQMPIPGSMVAEHKGYPVTVRTEWTGSTYDSSYYFNPWMEKYRRDDNVKFPFFLTPTHRYVGPAWYRTSVYVPKSWKRERITLFLERPHIETFAYINGHKVGHRNSLSVPHVYDVTDYINPGHRNDISICVYNGIENVGVGQDSHSVTDQTQGNWNGIVGRVELQGRPHKLNIRHVEVYPDIHKRQAKVVVTLENHTNGFRLLPLWDYFVKAEAVCRAPKTGQPIRVTSRMVEALRSRITLILNMGNQMQLWDEFSPVVYQLKVFAGDDEYETQFGMREISVRGRDIILNDHPIYMRGTVENCVFPLTGYPPTDEAEWMRIMKKCKEYGLNHIRFHSYCPPEAAFCAADRFGIYLQPEGPSWPNHGVKLGNGMTIDTYLMEETKRMVETYGNHPSFCMMASGNEPAGRWTEWIANWCDYWRKTDSRRIYCGASVGGGWEWDVGSDYHVKGGARGLNFNRPPQTLDTYIDEITIPRNFRPEGLSSLKSSRSLSGNVKVQKSKDKGQQPKDEDGTQIRSSFRSLPIGRAGGESVNTSPYISHEQGQWCAFPDLDERRQYTGAYRALNFDIFADLLEKNGMSSRARDFLMASGHLQALCYKLEMERNLRTPGYTGFQLLGLNDYSGQGTALVGVLNAFWREKGYITARQWRESCGPVVIMAALPRFVYTQGETLSADIILYNAFAPLKPTQMRWKLLNEDSTVCRQDSFLTAKIPLNKVNTLGHITLPFDSLTLGGRSLPRRFRLSLSADNVITNSYDLWVYPSALPPTGGVGEGPSIAPTLTPEAIETLRKGGTVLLTAAGKVRYGAAVKQQYLPVFWNTSWFKMKPPHTTGAVIDREHPLFRNFPTDDWANLNWWELLNRAQVMNLSELPADYQPPIQPIDTWHISRKLGMLIEANVLSGRLIMTTMDITNNLDSRPVARQMRYAILQYMSSPDFRPSLTLTPDQIRHFYEKDEPPVNLFTNESPDELKPRF